METLFNRNGHQLTAHWIDYKMKRFIWSAIESQKLIYDCTNIRFDSCELTYKRENKQTAFKFRYSVGFRDHTFYNHYGLFERMDGHLDDSIQSHFTGNEFNTITYTNLDLGNIWRIEMHLITTKRVGY